MSGYAGTGALLKLALRRDRVVVPLSVLGLVALAGGSAKSTVDLYSRARTPSTPPGRSGEPGDHRHVRPDRQPGQPRLVRDLQDPAAGRQCAWRSLAIVLVRRHTRTEEEAGRTELVGAGVVGRRAPLTAAVILAAGTVLVASLLAPLSLIGSGLGSRGSWAFGVAWATIGLTFTGVAAVAAQLTTHHPRRRGLGLRRPWRLLPAARDRRHRQRRRVIPDLALPARMGREDRGVRRGPVRRRRHSRRCTVLLIGPSPSPCRNDATSAPGCSRRAPVRPQAAPSLRSPWALAWRLQRGQPARLGDRLRHRRHRPRRGGRQRLVDRLQRADAGPAAQARRQRHLADRHLHLHRSCSSSRSAPPHTASRPPCGCAARRTTCTPSRSSPPAPGVTRCWPATR